MDQKRSYRYVAVNAAVAKEAHEVHLVSATQALVLRDPQKTCITLYNSVHFVDLGERIEVKFRSQISALFKGLQKGPKDSLL